MHTWRTLHMKNQIRNRVIAVVGTAAIGAIMLGIVTGNRSAAFTMIERQFAFNPVEITVDQTAHVAVNNTFGAQEIHITVDWSDGVSGAPIGTPFQANLLPGHGVVVPLPAAPTTNLPASSRMIIAVLKVSSAPGVAAIPPLIDKQVTGSLDVVDLSTGHVTVAHGFGILPAIQ